MAHKTLFIWQIVLFCLSLAFCFLLWRQQQSKWRLRKEEAATLPQHENTTLPPTKKQHCSIHMIMPAIRRPIEQFNYLHKTLHTLQSEIASPLFQPCLHLYSFREEDMYSIHEVAKQYVGHDLSITVHPIRTSTQYAGEMGIENELMWRKTLAMKAILLHAHANICSFASTNWVMLLEDDFEWCPGSFAHLAYIMNQLHQRHVDSWSGMRFSYDLSGLILQCRDLENLDKSLDHGTNAPIVQVEKYFQSNKSRPILTYRYSILEHIGDESSVGNDYNSVIDIPKCYETLTQLPTKQEFGMSCRSLISPCEKPENSARPNEILASRSFLDIKQGQHVLNLKSLLSIEAIVCDVSLSCDTCCSRRTQTCKDEYFPYVNHCNVIEEATGGTNTCKVCVLDSASYATAPRISDAECVLASRPSRMTCKAEHALSRRVCPCSR